MKTLTTAFHDRGNCRLYVSDQNYDSRKPANNGKGRIDANLVIIDQGHMAGKYGRQRFELHTMTRDGEPCSLINSPWVLLTGEEGTDFTPGIGLSDLDADEPMQFEANGYSVRYNPGSRQWDLSHPEIGACGNFNELSHAVIEAIKG
ncbi:hypothetical protein [Reinekea sp. G2M2-21]|uniref:hypothetical protein n=1 Tax=Reinekea sp. G2M2-21 TaxID=2788942 RepID=UPI0018AAEAD5|nr:hypothetical protein [Reinekea sp. G2M2-21]